MGRTFLILYIGSAFFLFILFSACACIYFIIIPQFTREYFSSFYNLQKSITSAVRLFILDAVL